MDRVWSCLLLCLALAAPGPAAAKPSALAGATAAPAVGILAIGDFGVGGTLEPAIGEAVRQYEAANPADVLVTLGDNDYTESPAAFHRNWVQAYGWLGGAGVSVSGTLGNHDVRVDGGRYEFDELNMPRARYSRVYGSVQLFVLNSNRVTARQTAWLESRLAASTATWKLVAFHHPAYTCGGYLGNPAVQRLWVPLFQRYDVDLALSGHDHNYQRFAARRGVRYVVHGGGGQKLYDLRACPSGYPDRLFGRSRRGFLYIVADSTSLTLRSVRPSGRVIDKLVIYP